MAKDGIVYLRLETVARGLGFTRIAASGNEVVRWETVRKYLNELGVPTSWHDDSQLVGKDGLPEFIPENIFIRERPPISGLFSFPVSVVGTSIWTRARAAAGNQIQRFLQRVPLGSGGGDDIGGRLRIVVRRDRDAVGFQQHLIFLLNHRWVPLSQ